MIMLELLETWMGMLDRELLQRVRALDLPAEQQLEILDCLLLHLVFGDLTKIQMQGFVTQEVR